MFDSHNLPYDQTMSKEQFKQSLDDPPPEIFENLVKMMASSSSGFKEVCLERFVEVNHAWNVFSIVDSLKDGALDPKELQPLMWLQYHQRPSDADVTKELETLGIEPEGMI